MWLKCSFNIFIYLLCINGYSFPQGLIGRWDSFQPWCDYVRGKSVFTAPLYSTCRWLEVPWWGSQTDRKKAGWEGHTWVYARTPSRHTPTCGLTLILSIHWYVQLSTGIFTELQTSEVCKFSQPYFPIWSLVFSYSADLPPLFIFPHFFLSARCHSQVLPALHALAFSSQVELNFSQPSLIYAASARHVSTQLAWVGFV